MGKRSDFERVERDYYPTPYAAVVPLLAHLAPGTRFCEPCAGDGRLIAHLESNGHKCASAWDIEPQHERIDKQDALNRLVGNIACFITNPPWDRPVLHALIKHLSAQHPTWLLFDADWMHTQQAATFIPHCRTIQSVGRVKWIEGSKMTGKDNCCWYLFDANWLAGPQFYGKEPK